jgi:hypothetical protein
MLPHRGYLQPHTDPYDVFVIQVSGQKDWTICTPQPDGSDGLSDAYKAQMQEIARHNIQGCTSYTKRDLSKMDCQQSTLHAGDVLYMPKGIVHYASTRDNTTSTHLTLGLDREGHTWRHVFRRQCQLAEADASCQQLEKLILNASLTATGLVWNDMATAPFSKEPSETICQQLTALITGNHPAALRQLLKAQPIRKANTYETTARELLRDLPRLAICKPAEVYDLMYHHKTSQNLNRNRRASNYNAPCLTGTRTCSSASSCDCDSGKLERNHHPELGSSNISRLR